MNTDQDISRSQRRARKQLMDATETAMETAHGRHFARWVLDRAGLFDPNADPGRRELGLEIVNLMNEIDPHLFVGLMRDGANEIVARRANANKDRGDEDVS